MDAVDVPSGDLTVGTKLPAAIPHPDVNKLLVMYT